ncbi:MAG: oligopeptide/dipeptide ABC transporter ATP-binding protein [Candidatus Eisenbacteria bacterium]
MTAETSLLAVRGLRKEYPLSGGLLGRVRGSVKAVDGVSFSVESGGTLALVGESGSGKSTIGRTVLRLEEPTAGEVRFEGRDLGALSAEELRPLRRRMQIVFQDPFGSLNPRMQVGGAIREVLEVHGIARGREAGERAASLLDMVGLRGSDGGRYPHEFSAGQRQRICIARALSLSPRFIVADEPVSALDVSNQAQIVNLLLALQERLRLSYLIITHNLAIVRHLAGRVAVLYLGRIVEEGSTGEVFRAPLHPYTEALLSASPSRDPLTRGRTLLLSGEIPSSMRIPPGCPFHPRCPRAGERCRTDVPRAVSPAPGRVTTCHLHDGGTGPDAEDRPPSPGRPSRPS